MYDTSLLESSEGTGGRGKGGGGSTSSGGSQAGKGSTSGVGGAAGGADGSGHSGGVPVYAGNAGETQTSGGSTSQGGAAAVGGSSSGGTGGVVSPGGSTSGGSSGEPGIELIDDMEGDRNVHILKVNNRNGFWYTSKDTPKADTSTTITDITVGFAPLLDPPRGDSKVGWHIVGSGFKTWGAQIGIALKNPAAIYDGSAYCGVRLFMKGVAPYLVFEISDKYSDPLGKICDPNATSGIKQCYDHMVTTVTVGKEWTEIRVPFKELSRKGFAIPTQPLARDGLFTLALTFAEPTGAAWDVWIDDIAFLTKPAGSNVCAGE